MDLQARLSYLIVLIVLRVQEAGIVSACNVYQLQRLGGLKRIGTSEFRIVSPEFSIFCP